MRLGWRAISGPVLTAATLLLAMLFERVVPTLPAPSPAPLLVCFVALAGALSGLASAMTSAIIAVIGATLIFLHHNGASDYGNADLVRLGVLAIAAVATAGITGLMRERLLGGFATERRSHATSARLSAALDWVDIGIVLLDAETRTEFINRAFRDYFAVPDEIADARPPFIALIHIKLRNGEVLRFVCTALPDGGRMLSYTPVTDLVRHTDAPSRADYYRSLRDPTSRKLIRYLRVAE